MTTAVTAGAAAPLAASPRLKAHIAGALYVGVIALGLFAELFVRGPVIVSGDAAATARNILAHEALWRASFVADLAGDALYVGVTVLLYDLLRPVNRSLSLLAAAFSLTGIAVWAVSALWQLAPLVFLGGAPYMAAFTPGQLRALSYAAVRLHGQGFAIGMVFFGAYCLSIGWLIFRSTFMPRIVGALVTLSGAASLIDSLAGFLAPGLDLSAYTFAPSLAGEASLTLWLLAAGVNVARWQERARAADRFTFEARLSPSPAA